MPCTVQIRDDILAFYNSCQAVRDLLPRPGYADGDTKWYSFMVSRQHYWKDLVNKYMFCNSELDVDRVTRPITAENILAHKCPERPALIPCAKSCLMHRKRVHKYTDPIVLCIDGSGKCAACNCIFHSRIRVLRHVMDRRNSSCREVILRLPPISNTDFLALVMKDRSECKIARRNGHSHPLARLNVLKADGKRIGHVQS